VPLRRNGEVIAWYAATYDIEDRKRAESELIESERRFREAQMELAHASRVVTMGQFTASIAHEVNQPLAALLTNAETALRWLAHQPPNLEKAKPAIERVIDDGKRAADIVSRIRDFSRKAPVRKDSLEVNAAIREVLGLTRVAMSDHGVLAKTQLSAGLPYVLGDRVQLQQVILNLIMNAIEAMSEVSDGSRELQISTSEAEAGSVLVAVSDSGPGLPPASVARMFEAFHTTKASGLGIGLSICRSIVEAHGGRLWAAANKPHGAVFYVMLPVGENSL
jgi:C4-dicarboxylate-specific signal transduction histidine kinase